MSFNEKEVTYKKQMAVQRNSDLIKKKLLEKISLDRIHGICKKKIINNTIASLNKAIEFMKGPQLYVGEGNGTPLQYPCLENPMDGEAW